MCTLIQSCVCLYVCHIFCTERCQLFVFFLWEHAVIASVFQSTCNPKSVRRKYFFKEENVGFVNFLNLSSIQRRVEYICGGRAWGGTPMTSVYFIILQTAVNKSDGGAVKLESVCEVPFRSWNFKCYNSEYQFISVRNKSLFTLRANKVWCLVIGVLSTFAWGREKIPCNSYSIKALSGLQVTEFRLIVGGLGSQWPI